MVGLPEFTRRTKRLSQEAQAVRQLFFAAKSPSDLVFVDLPKALGIDVLDRRGLTNEAQHALAKRLSSVLVELRVAYHGLLAELQKLLRDAFAIEGTLTLDQLRNVLRYGFVELDRYTIDKDGLRAFLGRINDPFGDDQQWLVGLGSFLARKPPEKWTDDDLEGVRFRLMEYGQRVRDLQRLRVAYAEHKAAGRDDFEVIFVRTIRQNHGELDSLVSVSETKRKVLTSFLAEISERLRALGSEDLTMAAVAILADEFLRSKSNRAAQELTVQDSPTRGIK
jgi:hypothetical protein